MHGLPGAPATPCWSVCSCIAGLHTDPCQGSACMHQRGIRCSALCMDKVWNLTILKNRRKTGDADVFSLDRVLRTSRNNAVRNMPSRGG